MNVACPRKKIKHKDNIEIRTCFHNNDYSLAGAANSLDKILPRFKSMQSKMTEWSNNRPTPFKSSIFTAWTLITCSCIVFLVFGVLFCWCRSPLKWMIFYLPFAKSCVCLPCLSVLTQFCLITSLTPSSISIRSANHIISPNARVKLRSTNVYTRCIFRVLPEQDTPSFCRVYPSLQRHSALPCGGS